MTIDIVMERIRQHANTAADVARGYIAVQKQTESEEDMYAALLALVAQARDEEAEACLQIVEGAVMRAVDSADALAAIRARIAARKGE